MSMSFLTEEEQEIFNEILAAEPGWSLPQFSHTPQQILWDRWRAIADTQDWDLFKEQVLDAHAEMASQAHFQLPQEYASHLLRAFTDAWVVFLVAKVAPHSRKEDLPMALINNQKPGMVVKAAQSYLDFLKARERGGGSGEPTWEDAQSKASKLGLVWQSLALPPQVEEE